MRKRKRSKSTKQVTASTSPASPSSNYAYFRKHMRIGWWSLLVFLSLGLMLEALHGFKVQWYVGADNATRRLMLTLGHAHGTLLALIHIAFAVAAREICKRSDGDLLWPSRCLLAAGILLPVGFLAGGISTYGGDPGLGILMVPAGGLLLVIGVFLTAMSVESFKPDDGT